MGVHALLGQTRVDVVGLLQVLHMDGSLRVLPVRLLRIERRGGLPSGRPLRAVAMCGLLRHVLNALPGARSVYL